MKVSLLEKENFELRGPVIDKMLIIIQSKTDSKSDPFPTDISTTTSTNAKPAQTNDNINSNSNNNNKKSKNNNKINNNICKNKSNNNNNNKNQKNNTSTNEKAVNNEKLQVQLEDIRKEKRMKSRQIKLIYRKEINQTNISILPTAQINSKVTDVKGPKGTVAIVGDSIMSGIREELLKTIKTQCKSKVF